MKYKATGETIFAPYKIHHFNGVKVGIIGMTLEGTPQIVTPAGISHVDFLDEAETANAAVAELKKQNVETIIVLLHEGGNTSTAGNGAGAGADQINLCANPTGAIPPIVDERWTTRSTSSSPATRTGPINCVMDGKIVTGAAVNGKVVTDIDLTISRASKDVVAAKVNNVAVSRDVAKAADLTTLVDEYRTLVAPLANKVVGSITADITSVNNPAGESAARRCDRGRAVRRDVTGGVRRRGGRLHEPGRDPHAASSTPILRAARLPGRSRTVSSSPCSRSTT